MSKPTQDRDAESVRREQIVERLPVLLDCLVDAIGQDAGDNPATYVLASVALEAARELQELEVIHGQA